MIDPLLKKNLQEHIDYILAVSKYCNLDNLEERGLTKEHLMKAPVGNIYELSRQAEEMYKLKRETEAYDRLLKEIDEHGVDYVKEKYKVGREDKSK